jgi:hypothetical protein
MASSITQKMFFPESQRRGLNEFPGADERAAEIRAGKKSNRLALQRLADENDLKRQRERDESALSIAGMKEQGETLRQQTELETERGLRDAKIDYYGALAEDARRPPTEKNRSLSDLKTLRENAKENFMLDYGLQELDGQLMTPSEGYTKEQILEMQRKARESGLKIYPAPMDESGERFTLRGVAPVYGEENTDRSEASGESTPGLADELAGLLKQSSNENFNSLSDDEVVRQINEEPKDLQSLSETNRTPFSETRLASLLGKTPQALAFKGYRGAYRGLYNRGIKPALNYLMSPPDEE